MSSDNDIVHFFLWVLHGENISAEANYYPFDFIFNSLAMYSEPFEFITTTEFHTLVQKPCKFLQGRCPFLPIYNEKRKKYEVFLPPLFFMVGSPDIEEAINEYLGLHYFSIRKTGVDTMKDPNDIYSYIGKDICEIVDSRKLINYEQILSLFGADNLISYAMILHEVKTLCNSAGIDPKNAIVGIFSCQGKNPLYASEYTKGTKALVPKVVRAPSAAKTNIYNDTTNLPPANSYASPLIIVFKGKLKPVQNVVPTVTRQGCGINVLSYYDILPKSKASEKIACLNLVGTPIYEVVNYLDDYVSKRGVTNHYAIVRYELQAGITALVNFIASFVNPPGSYALIFKLYDSLLQPDTNKFNQAGHSVSIAVYEGNIFFIDPQAQMSKNVTNEVKTHAAQLTVELVVQYLTEFIINTYHKNYIDIIFTVRDISGFVEDRPKIEFNNLIQVVKNENGYFITDGVNKPSSRQLSRDKTANDLTFEDYMTPEKMSFGGNNRKSKSKSKSKSRKSIQKSKKSKTFKSSSKSLKRTMSFFQNPSTTKDDLDISISHDKAGNEIMIGDYVKLNKQIDKAFGVPTLLRT